MSLLISTCPKGEQPKGDCESKRQLGKASEVEDVSQFLIISGSFDFAKGEHPKGGYESKRILERLVESRMLVSFWLFLSLLIYMSLQFSIVNNLLIKLSKSILAESSASS